MRTFTKVVVLLVLLVSFLDIPITPEYEVLEYFAGVGRIAALAKFAGYQSAALDIRYGEERFRAAGKRSPLDINSDAGLVRLVSKYNIIFYCWQPHWKTPQMEQALNSYTTVCSPVGVPVILFLVSMSSNT